MKKNKYIFGYGSLVSRRSIAQTFGRDPGELYPAATLNGWLREWSVMLDNTTTIRRFELLPNHQVPRFVGALNIRKPRSNEKATQPNGVLFEVTDEDIFKMDKRENHYTRREVTKDIIGSPGGIVFTYGGMREFCIPEKRKQEVILPKSYLDLVENGFSSISDAYLQTFRETTVPATIPIKESVHFSGF